MTPRPQGVDAEKQLDALKLRKDESQTKPRTSDRILDGEYIADNISSEPGRLRLQVKDGFLVKMERIKE